MTTEDPEGTTMRWGRDDPATTKVVKVATTTRIISRATEATVAPVGNSSNPREPHHTITIRVAAVATPTHIREETTTFPAQITAEEVTPLAVKVEIDTLMEEAVAIPLTVAPAEEATLIAEAINLDMMRDAGTIGLGTIEATNPHLEMIKYNSPINLRSWITSQVETTAQKMVPPDLIQAPHRCLKPQD